MKTRFLIFLCGVALAMQPTFSSSPQLDSIRNLIGSFQYSRALELIDQELAKGNDPALLYFYKGNALKEMYSFEQAIEAYRAAYAIDSTNMLVLINLANTYQANRQYEKSISYFSKASGYDPMNTFITVKIATNRYLNEEWSLARDVFLSLYRNDTANFYVLTRLGYCYNRMERVDSAILFFNKALLLNPTDVNTLKSYCVACISKKDYKSGIEKTAEYMAGDSGNFEISTANAYLHFLDKQYRQSIQKYNECLDHNFASIQVFKNLGIAYYRLNAYDTAKIYLEKAYQIDSTDANTVEFLSSACLNSYYKELGIRYYEEFIALSGFDLEKYAQMSYDLYNACLTWTRCPPEKLLSVSSQAYQLNPDKYDILYTIAYCYDSSVKDYPNAIKYYKRYLSEMRKFNGDKNTEGNNFIVEIIEKRLKELKSVK